MDPIGSAEDERLKGGGSVLVRRLGERRALFTIGQYAGGYRIYGFGENGDVAREMAWIGPRKEDGEQWAWDVDADGGAWNGDAPSSPGREPRPEGGSPRAVF